MKSTQFLLYRYRLILSNFLSQYSKDITLFSKCEFLLCVRKRSLVIIIYSLILSDFRGRHSTLNIPIRKLKHHSFSRWFSLTPALMHSFSGKRNSKKNKDDTLFKIVVTLIKFTTNKKYWRNKSKLICILLMLTSTFTAVTFSDNFTSLKNLFSLIHLKAVSGNF